MPALRRALHGMPAQVPATKTQSRSGAGWGALQARHSPRERRNALYAASAQLRPIPPSSVDVRPLRATRGASAPSFAPKPTEHTHCAVFVRAGSAGRTPAAWGGVALSEAGLSFELCHFHLVSSECPVASYSSTKSTSLFRGFVLSLRQCRSFVMPHGSTRRIHTAETSHLSPGGPACSNLDPDRGGKVGRCGAHDALLRVGARGVAPEVQRGAVRGAQGRQQQRHRGRLAMHLRGAARTRRGCWGAARLGGGGRVEAPGRRARQQ